MATVRKDSATNIKLSVENGVNAAGKTVLAARSFDGFAPDITDDLALELGTELGAMQEHEVHAVRRVDAAELVAG